MTAVGRGLRGLRVGEAKNPGPVTASTKVWSQNISSFHANGETVLKTAADSKVSLQECNLKPGAEPGARNTAKRLGWDMLFLPQTGTRKGGVAILAREPLGLSSLDKVQSPQFQLLMAAVHGLSTPLTICCGYRVPDEDDGFLQAFNGMLQAAHPSNWIACFDGNQNQLEGPIHDLMTGAGGHVGALARHIRSSHPIVPFK